MDINMKEFFKYFYFRVYTWQLKLWGESNSPQTAATGAIAIMLFVNILTPVLILDELKVINLFKENSIEPYYLIGIGIAIYTVIFYWLERNGKYKQIAKIYKDESRKTRNIKLLYIWIYILISFALPVFTSKLFWW